LDIAVAISYGNKLIHYRLVINHGLKKFILKIISIYPFNYVFKNQVSLNKTYYDLMIKHLSKSPNTNKNVISVLKKYNLDFDTLRGGCTSAAEINEKNLIYIFKN
tara:strand:+ start:496 stop:810 length:315 start_codon:yes stop_codon:yes gene_type:complete